MDKTGVSSSRWVSKSYHQYPDTALSTARSRESAFTSLEAGTGRQCTMTSGCSGLKNKAGWSCLSLKSNLTKKKKAKINWRRYNGRLFRRVVSHTLLALTRPTRIECTFTEVHLQMQARRALATCGSLTSRPESSVRSSSARALNPRPPYTVTQWATFRAHSTSSAGRLASSIIRRFGSLI